MLAVVFGVCLAQTTVHAQNVRMAADTVTVARLPTVEIPARDTGSTFAVFMSGDGGWADIDKRIAERLAQRGVAVIGLNLRDYLKTKRSAEEVSAAVSAVARAYGARWHRSRLLIIGFSRGANLAPFAVNRLTPDVRAQLSGIGMIGLNRAANFKWHFQDVFRDITRDDDVPTLPELEKIHDVPVVCVYGSDERESGCRGTASDVRRVERKGGHHLDGDFGAVADTLYDALVRR
jgi:type IV secretory pathway VirJ component